MLDGLKLGKVTKNFDVQFFSAAHFGGPLSQPRTRNGQNGALWQVWRLVWAWSPENSEKSTFVDFSAPGRASDLVATPIDVVWRVLTGAGEVLEVSGRKT